MLILSACGFQPLHSKNHQASLTYDLSSLEIEVSASRGTSGVNQSSATANRYSELLKAEILDQTNPTAIFSPKRFKLVIGYSEQETGLFVNPDGTASRGDLIYISHYTITRLTDAQPVADGSITRTSSYNTAPNADYASYVSIDDARKRGIMELAQDYKLRLAALLPTLNDPTATALESQTREKLPETHSVQPNENRPTGY